MKYNDKYDKESSGQPETLGEAGMQYVAVAGEFTIADYYALPEDYRAELIDEVIFKMEAPSLTHQNIAGRLYSIRI